MAERLDPPVPRPEQAPGALLAARLARALAPWDSDAVVGAAPGGGMRKAVRGVRVRGRRAVARWSRRPPAALDWELDLLEFLLRAGCRVPEVIRTAAGARRDGTLVVLSWLDGDPPAGADDWRAVAAELRRLHALTAGWPQRPGFRSTLELLEATAGGDVRLDLMPPEAVRVCRAAWAELAGEPRSVVHGDPGAGNIRLERGRVGFLDWDEARVDVSLLDLADLPLPVIEGIAPERLARARRAADAWEAANGWQIEPAYARRRLARLLAASPDHGPP